MSKHLTSGFFITFEGGEGSGKTTQINKLAKALSDEKWSVVTTREPGGTVEAEKIRDLLVQSNELDWSPLSEVLLILAARLQHVEQVIKPALAEGSIVICDRFSDSTLAYQGYGRGVDLKTIRQLSDLCLQGFTPHLTLLLDISPQDGLERASRRMNQGGLMMREDRFESLDTAFHEKIRNGFLEIAKAEPARCAVLNAGLNTDELAAQILQIVESRLMKVI